MIESGFRIGESLHLIVSRHGVIPVPQSAIPIWFVITFPPGATSTSKNGFPIPDENQIVATRSVPRLSTRTWR